MSRLTARMRVVLVAVVMAASLVPTIHRAAASAGPAVDPELRRQLRTAKPTDRLTVFAHGRDIASATSSVRSAKLRVVETWDRIGVTVANGTPRAIRSLSSSAAITYLEADRPIAFHLDTSNEATRGKEFYNGFDVTTTTTNTVKASGAGTSIAIVDSGIDGTHAMFQQEGKSKVVRNLKMACHDVTQMCTQPDDPLWVDMTAAGNDSDSVSGGGHGTHVAGIAGGVPVTSSDGREFHGAAPGAKLVGLSIGQVLSIYAGTSGLNWVLEHHQAPCGDGVAVVDCPPIRVVNNSWGPVGGGEFAPNSATTAVQRALVDAGVTVVWAAGNGDAVGDGGDGSDNRVNPPAQDAKPGVIGVANYDDNNTGNRDNGLDASSSRGEAGRPDTYPDVAAPGAFITSACRPQLPVCGTGFDTRDLNYNTISGTSMAAPHVAGIVAQLLELKPDLTPAVIEDVLEDTAHQFTFGAPYEPDPRNADHTTSFDKGHGLVDAIAAAGRVLSVEPPAPGVQCTPDGPVVLDGSGDANELVFETTAAGSPLPSEDSLDVLEGRVSWDATAEALTFTIKVKDLTAVDPPGSQGVLFDYNFTYKGTAYYVDAARNQFDAVAAGDAESFLLGKIDPLRTTIVSGLEGTFDVQNDVITVTLPNSKLTGTDVPLFMDGDVLTDFSIVARRDAFIVVPNADTAAGVCPFTLGLGAVPPPVPPPPPPPPPAPTISPESPEFSWTRGPITGAGVFFGCVFDLIGPTCDKQRIQVEVPAGGATLDVSLSSDLPEVNDFDLYLFGPDNAELDKSETAGSNESVSVPVTAPGIYTVEVRAFLTVQATYQATARLGAPVP